MPNYNKTLLMGHLTRDPEIRHVGGNNTAICSATIAVSKKMKNKQTGKYTEKTAFVDLKIWGASGERFAEWFQKGSAVFVDGELEQESWEDKNSGQKRSKLVVNVQDYQNANGRGEQQPVAAGSSSAPFDGNEDVAF